MKKDKKDLEEDVLEELQESELLDSESSDEAEESEETSSDTQDDSVESQLADALKKADENWDQFLRTKAEMENMRRRAQKDVENAHKYGTEKLIGELIPLKEAMELGLAIEDATVESIREGMELIMTSFNTMFEKLSIEEINPVDEKFDPECHQAMTMQPSADVEPNTVLQVLQKGYRLNDRLLRPAIVIVSKAAE